jgi:FKBP-type peptidyl-prolyl cis-trans isomerase
MRAQHHHLIFCRAANDHPSQRRERTKSKKSVVAAAAAARQNRRQFLSASQAACAFLFLPPRREESANALEEVKDKEEDKEEEVRENGLLLVNYEGRLKDGTVFDSTYGGLIRSTSGASVSVRESETQPVVISLNANAIQPGQVKGLKRGLLGAKRGEKREIAVKPEDGFGSSEIVSPLRVVVPAESELFYTVEVLRVSNAGVDALFKGVSLCGVGVANKTTAGCGDI